MSNIQNSSYILKILDGREVWVGGQKIDSSSYLALFGEELNRISELLDGRLESESLPRTGQKFFHYAPLQIPKTAKELEKQKYHLSYWFAEDPFFSEGWTDLAHAFLQGWLINRKNLDANFTEFSKLIARLVEAFKQEKLLVTIPYVLGLPQSVHHSSLKVTNLTDKGIFIQGTQKLPSDSLVVHELLTTASYQETEVLLIAPLNSEGLSLHIQEGNFDHTVTARFEDVFIQWDRILAQDKPENISQLFHSNLATAYPDYQRVASLLHQLEWITGLAFYAAQETGENEKLHIQESFGELLQQLDIIKAYLHVSEIKAENAAEGVVPNLFPLQTAKSQGIAFYKRAVDIIQRVGGNRLLQHLYEVENGEADQLYSFISKYGASSSTLRRLQYLTYYSGDPEQVWAEYYKEYSTNFLKNRLQDFWDFHETGDLYAALPKIT